MIGRWYRRRRVKRNRDREYATGLDRAGRAGRADGGGDGGAGGAWAGSADPAALQMVRNAVQMHGWHALALLACGLWAPRGGWLADWAGAAFVVAWCCSAARSMRWRCLASDGDAGACRWDAADAGLGAAWGFGAGRTTPPSAVTHRPLRFCPGGRRVGRPGACHSGSLQGDGRGGSRDGWPASHSRRNTRHRLEPSRRRRQAGERPGLSWQEEVRGHFYLAPT